MNRPIALFAALVPLVLLAGCGSSGGKVSQDELKKIEQSYAQDVRVGMSKADVEGLLAKANRSRLSSTMAEGVSIEEWRVEAYHDDDWNKTRSQFISFLYFADDTLVQISDTRLKYEQNPELLNTWTSNVKKK